VLLQPREEEASADAARLTLLKQEPPQSPLDVRLIVGPEFEVLAAGKSAKQLTAPDETTRIEGLAALDLHLVFNESAPDPMMEGLTQALIKLSLQNALLPIMAEKVPVFSWCRAFHR
jgi:hypothetical protein